MGLELQSIRDYLRTNQNVGAIVLEKSRGTVTGFKEAGILHKIKSFLGFSSAKNDNASTISEITEAIQNDSKLCAGFERAQTLLAAVKGTITTEKLSLILNTLDNEVNNMRADDYKEKVRNSISGYMAAKGAPAFLKESNIGVNLNNNKKFMTWYNKAAAAHVLGKSNGGLSGTLMDACASGINEFNNSFKTYFKVFKNHLSYPSEVERSRIETFANMCKDGKIMVTTPGGTLDHIKTLDNVNKLNEQLKRKTAMKAYGGKDFLDWYNKTADACVRDNQGKVPGNWQDSLDGRTKFDQFFGKCLDIFRGYDSRVEAFVEKCMAGKILVTTPDGAVDQEKTLANVTLLNEHLKLKDGIGKLTDEISKKEPPSVLTERGLDKDQKFMAWYNSTSARIALGKQDQYLSLGKQAQDEWDKENQINTHRTKFDKFFGRCLDIFGGNQSHIKTFAEKCMTGEILVTTPEGALNRPKTLEKVQQLKDQLDTADKMKEWGLDKNQKFLAWYNSTSAGIVRGKQAQYVSLGKQAQDEWDKENQINTHRTKFDQFFSRCLDIFGGNQSHINAFAEKCMAGKILVTTQDGALDQPKTLEKVQQLKDQLNMADKMNNK